ncbi:MAG: SH3 domain-containing protein [Bauldia sp.]|nr:SH3 domain-containing protein [Bauldia sp.]
MSVSVRLRAFVAGLATLAAASAAPALAQGNLAWSAYDVDEGGVRIGTLVFGVPETDDVVLVGICRPQPARQVDLTLYINPGVNVPGQQIQVTFGTNALALTTRAGRMIDSGFGPAGNVVLSRDDVLWGRFRADNEALFSLDGRNFFTASLRGSNAAITRFFRTCDTLWGIAPPATTPTQPAGTTPAGAVPNQPSPGQALTGPLFLVGSTPLRAFSNFTGGVELAPFPAGTELMSLNATGTSNGVEWLQVVSRRGAGQTAFVQRSLLVPTSGGATEYQNLNTAANLVIRTSPNTGASVAGTIPPNARGVFDAGQRSGNFVRVRYGNVTGWASHDYLLPILVGGATGGATAPAGAAPAGAAPAGGTPPATTTTTKPGATGGGAAGNPGVTGGATTPSALYVGRWFQIQGPTRCQTCTLDITDLGTSLSLNATTWVANVIWGADGDVTYATGQGFWTGGTFAGASFSIDVQVGPGALTATVTTNGAPQIVQYVR